MNQQVVTQRPLTREEYDLTRWMLEHGVPGAKDFLLQLEKASATTLRCPCGCASFDLSIEGHESPSGPMRILADFVFGGDTDLCGIFVWEQNGALAGVEVSGYAVGAPQPLHSRVKSFSL